MIIKVAGFFVEKIVGKYFSIKRLREFFGRKRQQKYN